MLDWNQRLVKGEKENKELHIRIEDMSAQLESLPSTLQLPAHNIIFEVPPNDEPEPTPLPDVIQTQKAAIEAANEQILAHEATLQEYDDRINSKADILTVGMVEQLMRDVTALQMRAKREDEEGVNVRVADKKVEVLLFADIQFYTSAGGAQAMRNAAGAVGADEP